MPINDIKTAELFACIEGASGDVKNKETGQYIKVLRGKKGKFGPEIAICVEAFEELKATKPYGWTDKAGKTWVPIGMKVWKNEKKEVAEPVATSDDDMNSEIPF